MENPATWGPAERVVNDVIRRRHTEALRGGVLVGLSLERQITDALRDEGLLEPAESELPADVMRALHLMRDTFCTAKDRLRETSAVSHEFYEHLVGQFFDGYQTAKRLYGVRRSAQETFEYGEIYRDVNGRPYRYITHGEWLDCASGQKMYIPGNPPGPLVKLVPENNHHCKSCDGHACEQAASDFAVEHSGMGVCNKGRIHYGDCDLGNGV